jgi:imidazole glycerol phosphate synthase glutamine amidotransferase subunit
VNVMKKPLVGIVDYQMGNLRSVAKAFEAAGARVRVTDRASVLRRSDILVVPGVGAFDAAMRALRRRRLDSFIRHWVRAGRPYIGICLGMQVLFERSEEAPGTRGLGIFKGVVRKFRPSPRLKVPHMGWNNVKYCRLPIADCRLNGKKCKSKMFFVDRQSDQFYFVHSYYAEPKDRSMVWTVTEHGKAFCSAVARGRLRATQFHPEKSGRIGGQLLKQMLYDIGGKAQSCS